MSSFITRIIILILGYAYPAFECFKIVEKNKPEIEQLIFWCQYWIIIAALTVLERVLDTFVSWLPMYSEAKLAFILYLWYPKTKGTSYVYETFVRPFVAKHELDIDRSLHELKARAGDMALLYGRKSSFYIQAKLFDILQYVATQSSRARPVQTVQPFRPAVSAAGSRQPSPAVPTAGPRQTAPAVPAAGPRQTAPAVPAAGSRQAAPAVASRPFNRQPTPAAGSQPTQTAVSDTPQQSAEPDRSDSGANLSSSTSESTEEMEVDLAEVQKEQIVQHEQNMEQTLRMTRNRLKQIRTQSNAKVD